MKAIKVENLSKSTLVGHNNARAESYTAPVCHSEAAMATEESQAKGTGRTVMMRCQWVEVLRFTQDDIEGWGPGFQKGMSF